MEKLFKKVILDTNFLVYCLEFKIDLFEELKKILDFPFEAYILSNSLKELNRIKGKNLILEWLKGKTLKILNIGKEESVDKTLEKLSKKGFIIATQDKELKNKLKKPYIVIRQKKYFLMVK